MAKILRSLPKPPPLELNSVGDDCTNLEMFILPHFFFFTEILHDKYAQESVENSSMQRMNKM